MSELLRFGVEREGSLMCLAIRSPDGTSATLSMRIAAFSALVATLNLCILPDGAESFELQNRGEFTLHGGIDHG